MKQLSLAQVRAIATTTILATAFAANGAVWNAETAHSWGGRDIGTECDIALDSNDDPHISYIDTVSGADDAGFYRINVLLKT